MRFLQTLTPRALNCRPALARPSEPLSRHRERGWGERADAPAATLGAILCAVRIDFRLSPQINPYPAQPATGVLGQSPKRVLLTFARTKVSPRRVGVLIRIYKRLAPPKARRNDDKAASRGLGRGTDICRGVPRRRRAEVRKPAVPPKTILWYCGGGVNYAVFCGGVS